MERDLRAEVRVLGGAVAAVGLAPQHGALEEAALRIASLTAGYDPSEVDRQGVSFRFGAALALASVVRAYRQGIPSPDVLALLRKSNRARILNAVAANPGLTQKALAGKLNLAEGNLSAYLQELASVGFVEPAIPVDPPGKAWMLTAWGKRVFLGQLEGPLADMLSPEELAQGVYGIASGVALGADREVADQSNALEPADSGPADYVSPRLVVNRLSQVRYWTKPLPSPDKFVRLVERSEGTVEPYKPRAMRESRFKESDITWRQRDAVLVEAQA